MGGEIPHLVALIQLQGLEVPELPEIPELHAVVVGGRGQVVPWGGFLYSGGWQQILLILCNSSIRGVAGVRTNIRPGLTYGQGGA